MVACSRELGGDTLLFGHIREQSYKSPRDVASLRGNDQHDIDRRSVCAPAESFISQTKRKDAMKLYSYTLRLAVAALTALGITAPLAAGEQVPFRGRFEGVSTVIEFNPPIVLAVTNGTGMATHLGRFLFQHPHTVNFATSQLAGTFNLVTANGDRIFADFSGQTSPTSAPGIVLVVGTATVTGGTGRFAGARGRFAIKRLFDPVTFISVGSFDGTISSPGAARR